MSDSITEWLSERVLTLWDSFEPIRDSIDIAIVAFGIYWLLRLIKGTRAEQMTAGLLVIYFASLVSKQLELATVDLILQNFLSWGVLIVIVIFQADIRRALTRVGRGFRTATGHQVATIEEIVRCAQALAQRRVGALLVVQREVELEEYMELGTRIDAELTRDLLLSLFLPYSPLHDGAVIVRDNRIAAAGCILPLALRSNIPSTLGTRHRAAHGVAEETDALAIVVSEETGRISLVCGTVDGAPQVYEDLDGPRLRHSLIRLAGLGPEVEAGDEPVAPAQTTASASERSSERAQRDDDEKMAGEPAG